MKKINYYYIIIIIFISCSGEGEKNNKYIDVETSFPESINLSPVKADDINDHLVYPNVLHIYDSTLVIIEKNINSDFIKFFSTSDFSLVGSYGSRGEGPNEYSNILHHMVQVNDSPGGLMPSIFDWQNKRISTLSNISNQPKPINYILPPELMLAQRAAFINDSTVIGMGSLEEGMLFWADIRTDDISYLPFTPKNDGNLSHHEIADLYRGEIAIDKKKGKIALTTKRFPEFIIMNLEGNIEKIVQYNFNVKPLNNTEDERKLYFKDIKVSEEYIYIVYLNKSFREMEEIYENYNKNHMGRIFTEVHVFDWTGEPIRKLLLEDIFVQFISIDNRYNRIFSIDVFSDDLSLVYFESDIIK